MRTVRLAFTVVELTITMCIVALLSAIAVPSAGRLLDRVHVRGAVLEIESAFASARHIAIARSALTSVGIDTVAAVVTVRVADDTVRSVRIGTDYDVKLSATRLEMSYSATGMGYGAANLSVVARRSEAVDTVFVSRLGRLRH
jgi:type II secretory pathway pseudopilin PulG